MGNEIITETPDAIQILDAKIEAFNKQWQEYNQNWTNISNITLPSGQSKYNKYGVTLAFGANNTIKYEKNTNSDTNEKIIITQVDDQLYYYLYNLPNNCGIYIKEENSTCYVTEDEKQTFSSNYFVYRNGNNFIEQQEMSDDYCTINWDEETENWTAENFENRYGITLNISGETITYIDEKTIIKQADDGPYYYLYNLPDNFGIRIKEENSICYIAKNRVQQFSSGYFVYYNGENFIGSQEAPNGYLIIDWDEEERKWSEPDTNNNTTLVFSGETIYADEKIIFEPKNNNKLYYLYNLPNHFGIRINEQNAVCYSKEGEKQDKRFSVGDLIYRDGSSFIITKDPTTSGYYFTIDPVNKRWVATYKPAFFTEVGSTFDFNFMQRLDSPYTYFKPIVGGYRDYVIQDVNNNVSNYCGENYGMEAPFHLYTIKHTDGNTYEEIYEDQTWYFRPEVINGELKNNLVILHEKPVSAESFYQLVR